ncbi:hypothetical protein SLE2022_318950 [Rubroshorea leprosula]
MRNFRLIVRAKQSWTSNSFWSLKGIEMGLALALALASMAAAIIVEAKKLEKPKITRGLRSGDRVRENRPKGPDLKTRAWIERENGENVRRFEGERRLGSERVP